MGMFVDTYYIRQIQPSFKDKWTIQYVHCTMYMYLSLYNLKFKLCSTKKHSSFGSLDSLSS